MFKIKLSILLLASFFIFSCTKNYTDRFNQEYSLAYIGGEFDGLLLEYYLKSSLRNLNIYNPNSDFEIQASISHDTNLFITNIDNTSDREKVTTYLYSSVINTLSECMIYSNTINVSQFYIYASGDKFLSNQTAVKKIKKDNTEALVKRFVNELGNLNSKCDE